MKEMLLTLIVLIVMAIAAKVLDHPVRAILKRFVNSKPVKKIVLKYYVKKADRLFPGPKRGQAKHTYVTQQAQRWHIKAGESVDELITSIVSILNQKSGSVKTQLKGKAEAAVDSIVEDITTAKKEDI